MYNCIFQFANIPINHAVTTPNAPRSETIVAGLGMVRDDVEKGVILRSAVPTTFFFVRYTHVVVHDTTQYVSPLACSVYTYTCVAHPIFLFSRAMFTSHNHAGQQD